MEHFNYTSSSGLRNPEVISVPVRFGVFELDTRTRELRKNGLRLKLPEQSIQILAMLLERPGELVTREELPKKVWPNDTVVEFDHSINAAIKRLRQALGDTAESPRFLETLPRRGYRFVYPVRTEAPMQPALAQPNEPVQAAVVEHWAPPKPTHRLFPRNATATWPAKPFPAIAALSRSGAVPWAWSIRQRTRAWAEAWLSSSYPTNTPRIVLL